MNWYKLSATQPSLPGVTWNIQPSLPGVKWNDIQNPPSIVDEYDSLEEELEDCSGLFQIRQIAEKWGLTNSSL